MEKIQSAIAKARAARTDARSGERPALAPRADEIRPDDVAGVSARWAALPSFEPDPALLSAGHIVAGVRGPGTALFDQMRTRLLQQMRANNWRRVAITSPDAACGKSTIALNLAMGLARQPDLRIFLAEMDMRRPSLARILGLGGKQNFARVLEGRDPFAAHTIRIGENLAISTCHAPHRHSAELLQSPTVPEVLDEIEAEYDPSISIFDLPPVFASDDTMAVMGKMDCVLILAAAESTKIKEIDRCERELATQTNIMGVVLNKCRYIDEEVYGYDSY